MAAGLLAIVGLGAVGGILANIALTPLTAGASLLQSYWYGSGLILGERMMYTVHWEKIKGRLDKGEDFLQVLDKIMNDDITAIANLSFKAMDETGKLYLDKAGESIADFAEKLLSAILGNPVEVTVEKATDTPKGETGISLTIAEIQKWTDSYLKQQHSQFLSKYTNATQQHIRTIYKSRFKSTGPTFEKLKETEKFKEQLEEQQGTNKEIDKIIETAPSVKRKAGQSQKIERNRLIQAIADANVKQHEARIVYNGTSGKINNGQTRLKAKERWLVKLRIMQSLQKELAMLLTRYQF